MNNVSDVQCTYNAPTSSGAATDNLKINGRIRLFNVWVVLGEDSGAVGTQMEMVFRNDSSATDGDILFKYGIQQVNWGPAENNLIIPGNGILFPDGLTFITGNSNTVEVVKAVTLIYQKG